MRLEIDGPITVEKLVERLSSGLPTRRANRGRLHMVAEYAPTEPLTLDLTRVSSGTPEGLVCLESLSGWLRDQAPNAHPVTVQQAGRLVGSDADSGGDAAAGRASSGYPPLLFPVRQLELPEAPSEGSTGSSSRVPMEIIDLAGPVAAAILEATAKRFDVSCLQSVVADFLLETLLNAHEHAYLGSSPGVTRSAWVAASLWPLPWLPCSADAEIWWMGAHDKGGATHYLEVSVADAGVGIVSTLGQEFLDRHEDERQRLDQQGRSAYFSLHDKILRWALAPYGSRKRPQEHRSQAVEQAWRGLYRVLYRASQCDGHIAVRSGYGQLGVAAFSRQQREFGTPYATSKEFERTFPWTSVTLRLALPGVARVSQAGSVRMPGTARGPADSSSIVAVPATFRARILADRRHEPDAVTRYAAAVSGAVAEAFAAFQSRGFLPPLHAEDQIAVIAHPAVSIGGPHTILDVAADSHSADVARVATVDADAAELLLLISASACPGILPVHALLSVSRDALLLARAQFAQPRDSSEVTPGVVGFSDTTTGRIEWLIRLDHCSDAAELAAANLVEIGSSCHPPWLDEMRSIHPTALSLESDSDGRVYCRLALPSHLGHRTVARALSLVLPDMGRRHAPTWYWRRSSGEAPRTTPRGHQVDEWVAPYALIAQERVVEEALSYALSATVSGHLGDSEELVLVPACEDACYALAKRLAQVITPLRPSRVLHLEDPALQRDPPRRVFLFADAVYSGDGLSEALARLPAATQSVSQIACFDLRPEKTKSSATGLSASMESIVVWPFSDPVLGQPVPDAADDVDPSTGEPVSLGERQLASAFNSLVWVHPLTCSAAVQEPAAGVLLKPQHFQYGFQWVGGLLQVVRYPLRLAVDEPHRRSVILEWLSRQILDQPAAESSEDVVLFARDESPLYDCLGAGAGELSARLRESRPSWKGQLWLARVPTGRRDGRQVIPRNLAASVESAVPLATPRQAQLRLFSEGDSGPAPGPRQPFRAVFVDNAAISGRTGREFALGLLGSPGSTPCHSVAVIPLLDKLSPSEERLLHHMPALVGATGFVPARFSFCSLLQLRIRSYRNAADTGLLRALHGPIEHAREMPLEEARVWAHTVGERIETLVAGLGAPPIQYPCLGGHSGMHDVSVDVVRLRHLLAMYEQGVSVFSDVVGTLRSLLFDNDLGLLTMFALEPELLREPLISGALD